jgi:leader peptidase (prepilin peptidase)/N-methyltransferase
MRLLILAASGGTVFATVAVVIGSDVSVTVRLFVVGAALAMVVASDLGERRIPNRIVLPAIALCLLLDATERIHWRALLAALAIVALLLLLAIVEPHALGMGDVKLALLIVAGLPIEASRALVGGLLGACVFGCALAAVRHRPLTEIALPLAPFFAVGALITFA